MELYSLKEYFDTKEQRTAFILEGKKKLVLDIDTGEPVPNWADQVGVFPDCIRYSIKLLTFVLKDTNIKPSDTVRFDSLTYYIGAENQKIFRAALVKWGVLTTEGGITDPFVELVKKRSWYLVYQPKAIVWLVSKEPSMLDHYPLLRSNINKLRADQGLEPLDLPVVKDPNDLELR